MAKESKRKQAKKLIEEIEGYIRDYPNVQYPDKDTVDDLLDCIGYDIYCLSKLI